MADLLLLLLLLLSVLLLRVMQWLVVYAFSVDFARV